ncbi:putative Ig domain-containing protein [Bryobacter aggregatus]|uniref:putative Ig domain-containing protein n=1 Tax=Bryobacter aggregatus TaxID=360054 RepID=UPI00068E40E0|nr:putative Ig domain-containing protein [Bryobacter aggregatus]
MALALLHAGTGTAAISLSNTTLPQANAGQPYNTSLTATGGLSPYTYTIGSGGALPQGLSLAANGTISGTPALAGSYNIPIQITDATPTSNIVTVALQVSSASGLSITTTAIPAGSVGASYDFTFSGQGGTTPYSWDLLFGSGALPSGMTLSASGRLAGTPTTAGVFPIVVRLTDAAGHSYQSGFTLQINAANLTISTTSLAGALVNVPYSQQLTAFGGIAPYSFGLLSGALPPGLSISSTGLISGLPSNGGTYNFFIRATDSTPNPMAAQASFSIVVAGTGPRIIVSSLPTGTLSQAYSGSLIAQGGTAPYSFSVVNGSLPSGLTLSANGAISGTPTASGISTVTVRVTDAAGLTAQRDLILNINSSAFAFTTTAVPGGFVNLPYSTSLSTVSGTAPITYSLLSGALPAGLTLGANGVISGTPTTVATSSFVVRAQDATGATAQAPLSIQIQSSNLSILQSALPTATVAQAYSSTLTPVNGVAPYTFTLLSGSLPAGLALSANGNISGIPTTAGLYQITVRLTDANQSTATATINLYVASTGLNITTISLPASRVGQAYASNLFASGGSLPYNFAVLNGSLPAGLTLTASGLISGVPTTAGTSNFTVRVTDNAGVTAQSTYTLPTNAANSFLVLPETLSSAQVARAYAATLTTIGGTAPFTFVLSSGALPPGLTLSAAGQISGTPTAAGNFGFGIQVTDANNASVAYNQAIAVSSSDLTITTTSVPPVQVGINYFTAFTGAGGTAPYTFSVLGGSLPPGLTLSAAGAVSGTATGTGSYPVTIRISDQSGNTATANYVFTVSGSGTLQITTTALSTARTNQPYSASILATGGLPPYVFDITSGTLPTGLSLAGNGLISGTPTINGTSTFSVRAIDGLGATSQVTYSLTVTSSSLFITTSELPSGRVDVAYSLNLASSGGTPSYSYSLVGGSLPTGITLNTAGHISGIPTVSGSFPVVIRVVDGVGANVQKAFTLNIASNGLAFTNVSLPIAYIGQQYLATLQAAGGVPPYTFSLTNGSVLPSGLTLNSNGQISGLPETASNNVLSFRVIDAAGATATVTLTLNVTQSTLRFGFTALPDANTGQAYSFTPTVLGGTAPYTFSIVGALPAGLVLTPAGVISGTPEQPGTFNVTLRAQDALGAAVQANYALTISGTGFRFTTTLTPPTLNQPYSQTLSTAGGTGTITYSLTSGSLPPGLSLSPAGVISGTPTTIGSSTFTLRATDSAGATANGNFTLLVSAPVITFTTRMLHSGTINQAYNQTIVVSGGTAPYSFLISDGALPPGLTLSSGGTISGAPTATGTYVFTVRATDARGSTNTADFLIGVAVVGAPSIAAVVNAANYADNGVSPGEILTIFGSNLGPANLLTFTVTNNRVPTLLGGTRILFDGVAAPVIYTSANQVAVVAPFFIADRSTVRMTVEYQGTVSAVLRLPVLPVKPAVFTLDSSGEGPAAAINQDGTVNTAANPARRETYVSLYLTGGGTTSPLLVDGLIVSSLATLTNSVAVSINGIPATVQYAGNAPTLVPGVDQINVKLPAGTRPGANTIQVTIGTTVTTTQTTVFVE